MENTNQSNPPSDFNKLLEFQKRITAIPKDSTNPFFKSKYFDVNTVIEAIRPILNEVGLVVQQPLGIEEGRNILITNVLDGDKIVISSTIYLPEQPDPQKLGSIITYFRRYALVSLLLLQGEEDDDANLARTASKTPKTDKVQPQAGKVSTTQPGALNEEWEGAPKAIRPLTKKQGDFILKLQSDRGMAQTSVEELRKYTSEQASKLIEELTNT